MKCKNCGKENLLQAKYCSSCGHAFSEEERQAAYGATVWGKLDKLKEAKSFVTLEAITSHPAFRVLFLAALIFIGIVTGTNKGSEMRPLDSSEYKVGYNRDRDEFYLFTEKDSVNVSVYLPGKPESIKVTAKREDEVIYTEEYAVTESPVLEKDSSVTYIVSGIYPEKEKEITILLYDPSVLNGTAGEGS